MADEKYRLKAAVNKTFIYVTLETQQSAVGTALVDQIRPDGNPEMPVLGIDFIVTDIIAHCNRADEIRLIDEPQKFVLVHGIFLTAKEKIERRAKPQVADMSLLIFYNPGYVFHPKTDLHGAVITFCKCRQIGRHIRQRGFNKSIGHNKLRALRCLP